MNEERPYPEDAAGTSPASSAADAADTPVIPDGGDAVTEASHTHPDPEPGFGQTGQVGQTATDAVPEAESQAEAEAEVEADREPPAPGTDASSGPASTSQAGNDAAAESGAESGEEEGEEGDEDDHSPVWVPEPDKLLLSLLFASHEYLDARGLREIMGPEWDTPRLRQLVRKLNRDLESGDMPFEIAETDGTFRLRTLPKYFPWTRKLFKDAAPRRLSQAALETLAIVAYKQPVTKAEIEAIRGVNVDGSMKTLLDKRLIDIGRRTDTLGQAFTYHTTREFMRYFGINRVPDDLPRLSEFEGILNAQSLIPQMGDDGEIQEFTRPDEDGEQLTLGMDGSPGSGEDGSGKAAPAVAASPDDVDEDASAASASVMPDLIEDEDEESDIEDDDENKESGLEDEDEESDFEDVDDDEDDDEDEDDEEDEDEDEDDDDDDEDEDEDDEDDDSGHVDLNEDADATLGEDDADNEEEEEDHDANGRS